MTIMQKIENRSRGGHDDKMPVYDHAVPLDHMQTRLDDKNLKKNLTDLEKYTNKCSGMIIVGSGPAGLNAALYAARLGIPSPLVLAGPQPGGLLTTTGMVENWPGILKMQGQELIDAQMKQAEESGAQIIHETVIRIDTTEWPFRIITDKNVYYGFTVLIASGSKIKKLGCKGEEEFWGKGVSSCAVCDALAHKNKSVIVVGGGDSACEEALQLVPHADHVYVCVRKSTMRASMAMQKKIKDNPKVTILYNVEIKEIQGDKDGITDALLVKNGNSEFLFSEINKHAPLTGVFLAIGHTPRTDFISDINIDENGLIVVQNQKTSHEGIYAAGDVCNTYRQACVAAAEGCIAALEAFNCLEKHSVNQEFITSYNYLWMKKGVKCENGVCYIDKQGSKSPVQSPSEQRNSEIKEVKAVDAYKDVIILKTPQEFNSLAKKHPKNFYIVQVAAAYCPPCKAMKKTLNEYKATKPNTVPTYIIEIESMPILQTNFALRGFPTLLLFYGDELISKKTGSMSLDQFVNWIISEKKNKKI